MIMPEETILELVDGNEVPVEIMESCGWAYYYTAPHCGRMWKSPPGVIPIVALNAVCLRNEEWFRDIVPVKT